MTPEQQDPAAELRAWMLGFTEALDRSAQAYRDSVLVPVAEAYGRAAQACLERNRPFIEALGQMAQDPAVRSYVEARERGDIPSPERPQPCHCFCPYSHPADKGVCDGEGVTTRRFTSRMTGPVDVSLCAPCAVTQGVTELSRR